MDKKINFTKPFKAKSLSEAIEGYRCVSKEFEEFDKNQNNEFHYSSYNFLECTKDEKLDFYNNELQMVECMVANKIYDNSGIPVNWFEIYKLLFNDEYAKVNKGDRKVVFPTGQSKRPVSDAAYMMWNGLQIIDLDIKNRELSKALKPLLFNSLNKFNWFLGICTSASGNSLHIWTKIDPITINQEDRRIEFLCNFRQKYSYIYIILLQYAEQYGYTKENIIEYLDMAMAKPQQGIFISSDKGALLNTNFHDLRLDINFEAAIENGIVSIDWINHPDLKEIFAKLEWFNNDKFDKLTNTSFDDLTNINDRDLSKNVRKHYKHTQRWQLANTLTNLYGQEKALKLMLEICDGTPKKEIIGDIRTAVIHNKPISIWAVKELNQSHGFKIELKPEVVKEEFDQGLERVKQKIDENALLDPLKELNSEIKHVTLHISSKQHLSDIKDNVIKELDHLTLLEAGAGYGKTEMIKKFNDRTLLVLPFKSTIQAKIENSKVTEDWLYFYGKDKPTLQDMMGDKNMSMTIDKFANINIHELNLSSFKYIVIDESHLLFTSSYRDVMSPTIQHLANCKAKVILMTGTPTAEVLFFPNIKHIKVYKDDIREKSFTYYLCPTRVEQTYELCHHIAKSILEGKHILFPTNKGNIYFDQICGIVQKCIEEIEDELPVEQRTNKKITYFYYKRSNVGETVMESINKESSIGDTDILFCSTYLSVGVDITDKYDFNIYFSEQLIGQDIEQYANRLRNNNLHIHMFLPLIDSAGYPVNYWATQPMEWGLSSEEMLKIRDLITTCNDMLTRNEEENKYSPFVNSIISANRYIKYDENECKYFFDNTTYKLHTFEETYKKFACQLEILTNVMKYYGYTVNQYTDNIPELSADASTKLENLMKSCKISRYNYKTQQTFDFLMHITDNNIDMYKELIKGDFSIFKDEKYKTEREENNLYTKDIEILEKNIPIVLSLYKNYDIENIIKIFKYCIDKKSNRINYSKLERIRKLVNIEYSRKKKRLDFPVLKFITDVRKFANEHQFIEQSDLEKWKDKYACKFANSIPGLVVDDNLYLSEIRDLVDDLFKVIVIQERPKNGIVQLHVFELLWESKEELKDIYGTMNIQNFFLQDMLEKMKDDYNETHKEDEVILPEFEIASKQKLNDVQEEINDMLIKDFDYYKYSDKDGSNTRFLKKEESHNRLKDGDLFFGKPDTLEEPETIHEKTLFD